MKEVQTPHPGQPRPTCRAPSLPHHRDLTNDPRKLRVKRTVDVRRQTPRHSPATGVKGDTVSPLLPRLTASRAPSAHPASPHHPAPQRPWER